MIGLSRGSTTRFAPLSILVLLAGALHFGTPAHAQVVSIPGSVRLYSVPNSSRYDAANMVLKPDGTIWTASASTTENAVVSLSPDGKKATRWTFPADAAPSFLLPESDGTFWVAELGGFKVAKFDPANNQLTEWADAARRPTGIIKRADGKLWIPETNGWLTLFDPATGTFTYHISTNTNVIHLSYPYADPDGTLWMADFGPGFAGIVRVEADGSKAQKWEFPDPYVEPTKVIRGVDGALWLSLYSQARLARFNPVTGEFKTYNLNSTTLPYHLLNYKDRIVYSDQGLGAIGFFDVFGAVAVETATITPKEITYRTEVQTVVPNTSTLTKTELDVPTVAKPSPVTGVQGNAFSDILSGQAYVWALTVDEARGRILFGTTSNIGELTPPLASPGDVFFPTAASIAGVGGARWQTDLYVWNRGTADSTGATKSMDVTERILPSGWIAGLTAATTPTVAANNIRLQEDVIAQDMKFPNLFGGLRLTASVNDSDLFASIRVVKKRDDGGTFGFQRNGVRAQGAFLIEEPGFLLTPADVENQRTNVGFFMVEAAAGEMTIVDSTGAVRARHTFSWPEGYHLQFSSVFSYFGLPNLPNARIVFSLTKGSILPYGISVEKTTSDPTDLPFFKSGNRAFTLEVLGALHRSSPLGERTQTDLQLYSASGAATISAVFRPALPAGEPGVGIEIGPVTIELPEKTVIEVKDILASFVGETSAAGTLELNANQPIYAASRVSAPDPDGGSYGYVLQGQTPGATVPSGSKAVFITATDSGWDVCQSDLLLTNPSSDPITVTVRATTYNGNAAGEKSIALGPGETRFLEAAFYTISGFGAPVGRLDAFSSAGSPFYALLLRGDRKSGDTDAVLPFEMTR